MITIDSKNARIWSRLGPSGAVGAAALELAEENSDVVVAKLNVDDVDDVAERFNIVSIPTLLIFKGGKLVKNFVGVTMKANILASLK